jgi:hypothetical protein
MNTPGSDVRTGSAGLFGDSPQGLARPYSGGRAQAESGLINTAAAKTSR